MFSKPNASNGAFKWNWKLNTKALWKWDKRMADEVIKTVPYHMIWGLRAILVCWFPSLDTYKYVWYIYILPTLCFTSQMLRTESFSLWAWVWWKYDLRSMRWQLNLMSEDDRLSRMLVCISWLVKQSRIVRIGSRSPLIRFPCHALRLSP